MKISILTPDLSGNCAGRAYILAQVLSRKYEVEIAGLGRTNDVWYPISSCNDVPIDLWSTNYKLDRFNILGNLKKIDCDLIYASKPVFNSFGLGLLKKGYCDLPLILDIDDWEWGGVKDFYGMATPFRKGLIAGYYVPFFMETCSPYTSFVLERMIDKADHITVSNSFLHQKYGGDIVPHGKDFSLYLVDESDILSTKMSLGIPEDKFVVMFLGTPRSHKGLEVLIEAVSMIECREMVLIIVGMNDKDPYSERVKEYGTRMLGDRIIFVGMQPYERMPSIISTADVMAIPSLETEFTKGQIPSKIFDAIAAGKPYVASAMNDMESISREVGTIVKPNDASALSKAIISIKEDYPNHLKKSLEGRARLEGQFSYDALFESLEPIIERFC